MWGANFQDFITGTTMKSDDVKEPVLGPKSTGDKNIVAQSHGSNHKIPWYQYLSSVSKVSDFVNLYSQNCHIGSITASTLGPLPVSQTMNDT